MNRYENVDDPVELLKLAHIRCEPDPLIRHEPCPIRIENLYAELDAGQIAALISHASTLFDRGDARQAQEIAKCLTAFTSADVNSLLRKFVLAELFHPGCMFLRANGDVRDSLIERLVHVRHHDDDVLTRNHLLLALAWIGDERVIELFAQWRAKPPLWARTLFVSPDRYAEEAGWQFSDDLTRRDLYSNTCYPLVRADGETPSFSAMAAAVTDRPDHCPLCGASLRNLVELHGDVAKRALPSWREHLGIPFCEFCFETSGKLGFDLTWTPQQVIPQHEYHAVCAERLPCRKLVMAPTPRSPWRAFDQFLPTIFSQIGGHPTWIEGVDYPPCPKCNESMSFIGQVALAELDDFRDGMHYAFLCAECRRTATRYQQT